MSPQDRFSSVLDKLARHTSTKRVRIEDAERHERNGGSNGELLDRLDPVITRLEQVAADLEKALS